jgi:predicted transcriptional regulator of viral defense system
MVLENTYRRRLSEVALDQYGYVTSDDCRRIGVPVVELRKLAGRGGLSNVGRGVYRFDDVPGTRWDSFMEAALLGGEGAVVAVDAVLALHELGQVNPPTLRVYTAHRVRRANRRDLTFIHHDVPDSERTRYHGVPSTTVAAALRDCRGHVMATRLAEAARQAHTDGLINDRELEALEGVQVLAS